MSWKCPYCKEQNDQEKMVCNCGSEYPDTAVSKQDAGTEGKNEGEESNAGFVAAVRDHSDKPPRGTVGTGTFTPQEKNRPGSFFLVIPAIPLLVLGLWLIYSNAMESYLSDTGEILVVVSAIFFFKIFSGRFGGERVRKHRGRL